MCTRDGGIVWPDPPANFMIVGGFATGIGTESAHDHDRAPVAGAFDAGGVEVAPIRRRSLIVMAFVPIWLTKSITIMVRARDLFRCLAGSGSLVGSLIVSGFATEIGTESTHDHGRGLTGNSCHRAGVFPNLVG
jgi:hypothetical protein